MHNTCLPTYDSRSYTLLIRFVAESKTNEGMTATISYNYTKGNVKQLLWF